MDTNVVYVENLRGLEKKKPWLNKKLFQKASLNRLNRIECKTNQTIDYKFEIFCVVVKHLKVLGLFWIALLLILFVWFRYNKQSDLPQIRTYLDSLEVSNVISGI